MALYEKLHALVVDGTLKAAYTVDGTGVMAATAKMAFGNKLGVSYADSLTEKSYSVIRSVRSLQKWHRKILQSFRLINWSAA